MNQYYKPLLLAGTVFFEGCGEVGNLVYVSDTIFTNPEDPVCRFLSRKLLPLLYDPSILRMPYPAHVKVENLNKFILKPKVPKLEDLNLQVQQILSNSITEILENLP